MASAAQALINEIQAQFPGALVQGRGRKHLDFSLPDGRSVLVSEPADLHYRDGLGQWQEVDEGLVDDGADGFAKRCDKTRHTLRIGNGGARRWYPRRNVPGEYVDITAIQYWRTTGAGSWRAINLPAAVWRQQGADWDLPNLYASVTNTWRRIKADFILKDSTAPTRLRFAVTLVGLTLDANWHLISNADAVDVGSIDPPTAVDANEQPVPVSAVYSGGYIEWSADTSAAVYPVIVDPTLTDGYGSTPNSAYDTCLESGQPTTNMGTSDWLCMMENFFDNYRYSLLKFDLTSLSGATVTSGNLYLYVNSGGAQGQTDFSINVNALLVSGWTEAGATYNTYDGTTAWPGSAGASTAGTDYNATIDGTFSVTTPALSGDAEVNISLTPSRVEAVAAANYGWRVSVTTKGEIFSSSDYATTAYRPKLVVVYTAASSAPFPPFPPRLIVQI